MNVLWLKFDHTLAGGELWTTQPGGLDLTLTQG